MSFFKHFKNRALAEESGFSLIELLVVVLIIAILAVVMVPQFLSQRDSAKNNNAISTITNVEKTLSSYFNRNDETFCSGGQTGCGTALVADLNSLAGGENSMTWTNDGGADGNVPAYGASAPGRSGDANSDKTVYIKDVVAGRYGGITFCVGSKGSKNYCGTWLANNGQNAAGTFWTISSKAGGTDGNVVTGGLVVTAGDNSTKAVASAPTVVANDAVVTTGLKN